MVRKLILVMFWGNFFFLLGFLKDLGWVGFLFYLVKGEKFRFYLEVLGFFVVVFFCFMILLFRLFFFICGILMFWVGLEILFLWFFLLIIVLVVAIFIVVFKVVVVRKYFIERLLFD